MTHTVVGEAVQTQDGSTIIPISKVSFGFVAGGGEYGHLQSGERREDMPFAGGAGAGVSVHPMGFLVCSQNGVRMLSAGCASPVERIVEMIPQVLGGIQSMREEDEKAERVARRVSAAYQE